MIWFGRRWTFSILLTAVAFGLAGAPAPLASSDALLPDGRKAVTLLGESGERQVIGSVTFKRTGDTSSFELNLDPARFQDEFLSMRPFSCLPGDRETWCHLAYPYDLNRTITAADLADLEYSLLFLFKPPAGYGIDPWNGLYFKLALGADGVLSGTVHDVNLDPLGVPPADRAVRTIQDSDLTKSDPASRRFSRIEIR